MARLDGKVAFITGAARGQGRSHALTLAREGADVAICDVVGQMKTVPYPLATGEDLEETARMVEELGRRCVCMQADVRSSEEMRAVADRAVGELGRIDILCANAGISTYAKSWELTDEQWDEVIGVNLTGAWKSCRAVIPYMISGGGGAIVMTSSVAGLKGLPGLAHYAAAKHGVVGLMRSLAYELAEHNVRVNSIHPTGVNTPMVDNEVMGPLVDEHREYALGGVNLMGNVLTEPQDVSNAVLWLVSDEARYVTGVALPIDAGALVK